MDSTGSSSSFFGRQPGAVTRHVRFVWVVKSRGQLGWLSEQLSSISTEVQTLQERLRDIKLELTVYVTCDKSFTEEHKTLLSSITAPNHNVPVRKDIEHGAVQYRGRASPVGEEKVTDTKDVREVTRAASDEIQQSCRPDGTCCCRKNVDENATADSIATHAYRLLDHLLSKSFWFTPPSQSTLAGRRRKISSADYSNKRSESLLLLYADRRAWSPTLSKTSAR
jgi:hypothetical protein